MEHPLNQSFSTYCFCTSSLLIQSLILTIPIVSAYKYKIPILVSFYSDFSNKIEGKYSERREKTDEIVGMKSCNTGHYNTVTN